MLKYFYYEPVHTPFDTVIHYINLRKCDLFERI